LVLLDDLFDFCLDSVMLTVGKCGSNFFILTYYINYYEWYIEFKLIKKAVWKLYKNERGKISSTSLTKCINHVSIIQR